MNRLCWSVWWHDSKTLNDLEMWSMKKRKKKKQPFEPLTKQCHSLVSLTIDIHRKFQPEQMYNVFVSMSKDYLFSSMAFHDIGFMTQTIEPPGNSFRLCAQTIAIYRKCSTTPTAILFRHAFAISIEHTVCSMNKQSVSLTHSPFI